MGLDIESFVRLRPWLYHLTSERNFDAILSSGGLHCAARLFAMSNTPEGDGIVRGNSASIAVGKWQVCIRDQMPLKAGHVDWEEGWNLERFVKHVNAHVFFWPGDDANPITAGRRHLMRYRGEDTVLIKVKTQALIHGSGSRQPYFCKFNSGAPRTINGKRSPRGSGTFRAAKDVDFTPGRVQEVVFKGGVGLPQEFCYLPSRHGSWLVHYFSDVIFEYQEKFPAGAPPAPEDTIIGHLARPYPY